MPKAIDDILKDEKKFTEVAKQAFDSVDTDKSGQIDANELEQILSQISKDMGTDAPSKKDVMEVLEYLDEDGSGKISFEEFKKLIKDLLQAMMTEDE